ncbi:DM (Doublesex/MAB-3) Domain family [Aphelenchoides besseyi]|nr:DM (Doublesex/MAB-3) Domain family [Aphelenchoides besseyi]KAI6220701.1 DM (Doublesex/MAB-3) Domain family [Aphelenchoides besseyi]
MEGQKFFALGKRVPKDVKRFCGICRQHGVLEETRGHVCSFKDCQCNKCDLVRTRRLIMSQQIRLRRAQDRRFQRTNEPTQADVFPTGDKELILDAKSMCYFCQKCKNHEILVWKKQHKRQCPFTNCPCEKCELIETRRRLDQHIKKRKYSGDENVSPKSSRFSSITPDVSVSPRNENQFSAQYPQLSPSLIADTKPQDVVQTVCIPIFVPIPKVSIDTAQLSMSQLLQHAAAQHFAAQLPPKTFHLVSNPQPSMTSLFQNVCNDLNGFANFQQT